MSKTTVQASGGIGFTGALTLIFVIAKLIGLIGWSWWLVFSPLLIAGFLVLLILLVALLAVIAAVS